MGSCYVYGAQTTAYGIARALEHAGHSLAGYVVTDRSGNPASIRGMRVYGIDELDPADCPKFFIAVPEYLHGEIARILEGRGFFDYVCMDSGKEYRLMRDYYRGTGRLRFLEDYAEDGGEEPVHEDGTGSLEIYVARSAQDKPLREMPRVPSGSVGVQAGAAIGPRISAQFFDDTGENISERNCHYDELTVTYWAWKNRRARCKGIAHYRRCIEISPAERAALLSGRIDAVLPLPFLCYPDTSMQYGRYNRPEAVDAMLAAVGIVHGQRMRKSAEDVLRGDLLYNYNMLVARAEVFDAYCAWLFPVLEQVEALYRDMLPEGEHTRVCGHLGEILGTIYFLACGRELRIAHGRKKWFV